MKKSIPVILISVLLSGLTAYAVVKGTAPSGTQTTTVYASDGAAYRTVNLAETDYPDLTYAAESAVDAVVFVKVTVKQQQQQYQIDPFFRYFFGDDAMPQAREREVQGSGSGVIIREDGYIVTNNHVVQSATKIEVTLNNNKTYDATVIGTDPATDVALIKIDAAGLPTIPFADSDKLRLGEWVLAVGSPLGEELRSTITAGIVSAKGRSMPNYTGEFKIESFIQTDAAVNPGNSGGALVNKEGKLVGINTAIVSTTGSYSGYSFAVPSNIVSKIVGDLMDFGSVKRAKLGISMSPITNERAKELNLPSVDGAYIEEVVKGGAADKAGLKKGDVLVAIDSAAVKTSSAVQEKVNSYHPDDEAVVTVIRDGKKMDFKVVFQGAAAETGTVDETGAVAFYGGKIAAPSKETLAQYGLKKGVQIVDAGSGKLAGAGAQTGDMIMYVNDKEVSSVEDVLEIVKKSKRTVYIEGRNAAGQPVLFGFSKE